MILEVTGLDVRYGPLTAVRDAHLQVGEGEIVTILGPNGAGKTSLLRALSGLIKPACGRILIGGQDVTRLPAHKRARMGLLHVPEGRGIFDILTVEENLRLGGRGLPTPEVSRRLAEVFEIFPVLGERRQGHAGLLSGGEQQILAVARGLINKPRLLMIDEPTMGLAPVMVQEVIASLEGIIAAGTSILLAEQNAAVAMRVASRTHVLVGGELVADVSGEMDEDALFATYLE